MYFPYFRGRQYELLALKELASKSLITNSVVPVIEPVKLIPALNNSLSAFKNADLPVALILNPNVGDLTDEPAMINDLFERISDASSHLIPALLLNESFSTALEKANEHGIAPDSLLVVFDNRDYVKTYQSFTDSYMPRYTLCPDERSIRRTIRSNKVLFENRFKKRSRNADYPLDEFYSDDHLDFEADNYVGFGDYSIVGEEYIESGFAPYAVAIHIVYFDTDNSMRIKHFISDSNDDIYDVAGKFYEAVSKLHHWYISEHQDRQLTAGLQILLDHYEHKTYPGLPTLKKLSIMHHLELMGKFLDGRLPE